MMEEVFKVDIKSKIEEIAEKIKNDSNFASNFKSDPIKTVEDVIGVQFPNDQIEKVVEGIKARISADDVKDKVSGFLGKFGIK